MIYLIFAGLMGLGLATTTPVANVAPVIASRRKQSRQLARRWMRGS
jgi:hypothetical protein